MATDDIETAIQRAAEKSRPSRKESLTSKVLKSWESIEQYRSNGGTVRALAAEMGIDEKQLSQAIFQAKKQIEKRKGHVSNTQKSTTKKEVDKPQPQPQAEQQKTIAHSPTDIRDLMKKKVDLNDYTNIEEEDK